MHCVKCGTPVPPGAAYCQTCGNAVTDPGSATVQIATAEEQDQLLVQLRQDLAADYEIEKLVGRGGMAVVYRAVERDLQRVVAIKVLPPGTTGEMAERFRREARVAAQLGHQNIIPVYRVGQAAGTQFFAMKFVEGRALDAIIEQQGALPIPVVLAVLRGAVAGLAFAHEKGVIHRDIKGANILIERDGHVLLSDLGIARAVEDKTLTATGSVIGTPHFMSPEQCSGQKVAPQSDQYSMGVLAFQMLTGQVPFDAETLMGILQHHFFSPVPDIAGVRDDVPAELVQVVGRALAKEAADRYATTREMLRAIESVPFSEPDRMAAEDTLRQLAVGSAVPRVRTGSLPPLPDTRTLGRPGTRPEVSAESTAPTVRVARTSRERLPDRPFRRRRLAPAILVAAVVLASAGGGGLVLIRQQATRRAAADSAAAETRRADSLAALRRADSIAAAVAARADSAPAAAPGQREPQRGPAQRPSPATSAGTPPPATSGAVEPAPAGTGLLRVSVSPPNAQIAVDGRVLGVGALFDEELRAGPHRLRVTAPGHLTREMSFTVGAGSTNNLGRITLEPQP